jgi:hypothetical protein
MNTELTLPPLLGMPGLAEPQLQTKVSDPPQRKRTRREPPPEVDVFLRIAKEGRYALDPTLERNVQTACAELTRYAHEKGTDALAEGTITTVQSTLSRLLIQLSVRIDIEQGRAVTTTPQAPIARVVEQTYLPLLERLVGLFMKIERERSSARHARKLSDNKVPTEGRPHA